MSTGPLLFLASTSPTIIISRPVYVLFSLVLYAHVTVDAVTGGHSSWLKKMEARRGEIGLNGSSRSGVSGWNHW